MMKVLNGIVFVLLLSLQARAAETTTVPSQPRAAETGASLAPKSQSAIAVEKPDAAKILWAKYRSKYACIDGEYIRLPDFNLRYENSRGRTRLPEEQIYDTVYHTERVTRKTGSKILVSPGVPRQNILPVYEYEHETVEVEVPTVVRKSPQEIEELERTWHKELPDLKVGKFGFWPSNERLCVTYVLGPDDVVLSCNEISFRLKGVDAADMKEGDEVKVLRTYVAGRVRVIESDAETTARTSRPRGDAEISIRSSATTKMYETDSVEKYGTWFSIAIIAERPIEGLGDTPTLLAIPTEHVRQGLSLEHFTEMLNSGIDPEK